MGGLRALVAPQIELWVDGATPFERFPRDTPLPLLEWGINYALAARLCCYLLLHAGCVARADAGVLLPAMPGSGKSTLTARCRAVAIGCCPTSLACCDRPTACCLRCCGRSH